MRLPVLLLTISAAATAPLPHRPEPTPPSLRLADLSETVPGIFLSLVNKAIRGSISPRSIRYTPPSTVVLEDVVLADPRGVPVARVRRGEATLSLRALLSSEIVISAITLDEPKLVLETRDGTLNLLEALEPRSPPDRSKPADTAFRIDAITVSNGGFRYTDAENVTVVADGLSAQASLEIDLSRDLVFVDVSAADMREGSVRLPALDVPLRNLRADAVRVFKDAVDLQGVEGFAAGARVQIDGRVGLGSTGRIDLRGSVDVPTNTWPERLERLPFDTPAVRGDVRLEGTASTLVLSVDAAVGPGAAYGYTFSGGRAALAIDGDRLRLLEGTSLTLGGGALSVQGTVALGTRALDLQVRADAVPIAAALEPADLSSPASGTLSARASLQGKADGESPIVVDGTFNGRRVELSGVRARGELEGSARITVLSDRVVIDELAVRGDRLQARARGEYGVSKRLLDLELSAEADDATALVPAIPPEVRADGVAFDGTLGGTTSAWTVEGKVRAARGSAYGVPLQSMEGRIAATAERVMVDGLRATVAAGALRQTRPLTLSLGRQQELEGTFELDALDLAQIQAAQPDRSSLALAGRASLTATVFGPTERLAVDVDIRASETVVAEETIGDVRARGRATPKGLSLEDVTVHGPLLHASAAAVTLGFEELELGGAVDIEQLDLTAMHAASAAQLAGTARGRMQLGGTVRSPMVVGSFEARSVAVGPQRFGDGPLRVELLADPDAPVGTRGHVVRASTHLATERGAWDAAIALALERRMVNARLVLADVDVSSLAAHAGDALAPLEGLASGMLEASGPLASPSAQVRVLVPELAVRTAARAMGGDLAPASAGDRSSWQTPAAPATTLRPLGSVAFEASMDAGQLSGRLCAFPTEQSATDPDTPCTRDMRLWATMAGSIEPTSGSFDVRIGTHGREPALEDFFTALSKREFGAGVEGKVLAHVARRPEAKTTVLLDAELTHATLEPPGGLTAALTAPARVTYDGARVQLTTPATFAAPGGEVNVTVSGDVGHDDIGLSVEGTAALSLVKLFTPQVANASGTATTRLRVRGAYEEGVSVEGELVPAPGAWVTPRALGQPFTFESGRILLSPIVVEGRQLLHVEFAGLTARLGDTGRLQVRGSVDARTSRGANEGWVKAWNVAASGGALPFRTKTLRGEGAIDLTLTGDEKQPSLRGTVELTEGLFRENLELRNFVLAPPPEKESDPLWITLGPLGLSELSLDVRTTLQNFRMRINVADFDADLLLRGNLRLANTLRLPAIAGAIEVEEGVIDFPRARFDVMEMQVEFPTTSDGTLNPVVHLSARAEIPPGGAGSNDTEIPVDLFLDGSFDDGINLDLSATDPQREWSRSDLLGIILFGQSFESTVANADASIAMRALMREATAPITAELERLAQSTLGVKVEIDPSGWRWQLGRRLQVEGAVQFLNATDSTAVASTATNTTNTAFDAVRLRLLIVDHLRIGKNLSFEGRQGTSGGDLRLSLRIFED